MNGEGEILQKVQQAIAGTRPGATAMSISLRNTGNVRLSFPGPVGWWEMTPDEADILAGALTELARRARGER